MTMWEENRARQNMPWNGSVQARGKRTARYLSFLASLPSELRSIRAVEVQEGPIAVLGRHVGERLVVPAHGCGIFLSRKE